MTEAWRAVALASVLTTLALADPTPAPYLFDSWTTQNGLPQNSINAIRQTRDGYMWMATNAGLMRFDGVRFQVFRSATTPGLTTDRYTFSALFEDREGALWAGTLDGGVVRYFRGVFRSFTKGDGLPSNWVVRIDEDESGTVWIFCDQGLCQFRQGRLIRVAPQAGSEFNSALDPQPAHVGFDGNHWGLWRMDALGWQRFAYGKWTRLPLPPRIKRPEQLDINSIYEDGHHNLWFNLRNHHGTYYCASQGRLTVFKGLSTNAFVTYQDRRGYLWMSDHDGNAALWKDGRSLALAGLHTFSPFHVIEDREGGLWVGTLNEGLFHVRPAFIRSIPIHGGPEVGSSLLASGDGKKIWIGSIGLQQHQRGLTTSLVPKPAVWRPKDLLAAMCEDSADVLLLGSRVDVSYFQNGRRTPAAWSAPIKGSVNVIHKSRAGELWIGTSVGLYRFRNGKLLHYTHADGLAVDWVTTLREGQRGELWIGTREGLSRFSGQHLIAWRQTKPWRWGGVASIYEDSAGVWWIGTYSMGLLRIENGAVAQYTTEQGLPTDSILQILEDDQGFVWISSEIGLIRVRKAELSAVAAGKLARVTTTRFSRTESNLNIVADTFGQPGCLKAADGKLWFSTFGRVVVIDPKAIPFNRNAPAVKVEDCAIDQGAVDCQHGLTIGPGQQSLEIAYTALSFVRSADITFKYKVDGLDSDWQAVGTRRIAYYSRLPPGHYVFRVIAANSDGVWNSEGQTLPITVLPPFYRTWWFEFTGTMLGTLAVWYLWQSRTRRFERARVAQQAFSRQLIASQESERKRIAAELHDSLGQRLLIMKNLALLQLQALRMNGTKVAQLEEISAEASRALGEVREISYGLRPYQLDRLGLTKAIEALVQSATSATNTIFSSDIDNIDELFPEQSRINVYRILQESVNNIIKHSAAARAGVSVRHTAGQVHLIVSDNGKGFNPGAVEADPRQGGFGLTGIAERVQLLGGRMELSSTPGEGAEIHIQFDTPGARNGK